MPNFPVAHVREQGVDLILIPLSESFGRKTDSEQTEIINELQWRANSAGLAGTVIPFWGNSRRQQFIAPPNWHRFLRSLSSIDIQCSLNRELYW